MCVHQAVRYDNVWYDVKMWFFGWYFAQIWMEVLHGVWFRAGNFLSMFAGRFERHSWWTFVVSRSRACWGTEDFCQGIQRHQVSSSHRHLWLLKKDEPSLVQEGLQSCSVWHLAWWPQWWHPIQERVFESIPLLGTFLQIWSLNMCECVFYICYLFWHSKCTQDDICSPILWFQLENEVLWWTMNFLAPGLGLSLVVGGVIIGGPPCAMNVFLHPERMRICKNLCDLDRFCKIWTCFFKNRCI